MSLKQATLCSSLEEGIVVFLTRYIPRSSMTCCMKSLLRHHHWVLSLSHLHTASSQPALPAPPHYLLLVPLALPPFPQAAQASLVSPSLHTGGVILHYFSQVVREQKNYLREPVRPPPSNRESSRPDSSSWRSLLMSLMPNRREMLAGLSM